MADKGYIRIEGANICYTDNVGTKRKIPYDSGYSTYVGTNSKGYIWLDETDALKVYYIDEYGAKKRTELSELGGQTPGVNSKGYTWIGTDNYLHFINVNGNERKILGTVAPTPVYDIFYLEPTTSAGLGVVLNQNYPGTSTQLEVSYDKTTWTDYTIGTTVNVNYGERLYMRNKSTTQVSFAERYTFNNSGGEFNAGGDIGYLLCKNSTLDLTGSFFVELFANSLIVTPPVLPATTLSRACYFGMFADCLVLTTAPLLPATTLAEDCYFGMFAGCTSLTTPPQLPATILARGCYEFMFGECTSLTTLPVLPATTLTESCYYEMFDSCTNIKISETQGGEYQNAYRIPSSGTGTDDNNALFYMFHDTGGTFAGTPDINTTYYTSNTVI